MKVKKPNLTEKQKAAFELVKTDTVVEKDVAVSVATLRYVKEAYHQARRNGSRRGLKEIVDDVRQLQVEGRLPQYPGMKGFVSQRETKKTS